MRSARALVRAALLAATFAPAARAAAAPTPAAAPASRPAPPAVPQFEHVIVVIMENKSADRASDPVACPFTAEFAKSYTWFQESYAITHPSQPNYLALWAGSTLGVNDNSCPARGSPFNAENFGHALEAAKRTWRAYSEALPGPGATACRAQGDLYTRKHAPWTQFGNLDHRNERPYTDLAGDIAGHSLPDLAFVVPDNCHNSHSCSASTGDKWLASELTTMMGAVGRHGLLVLTFDEDDHSSDNHILTVFAGPLVRPGTSSARRITHYTLVRTLCDGLGIPPFGEAVNEKPITDVWYRVAPPRTEPSKP
jgi:phospholipase C